MKSKVFTVMRKELARFFGDKRTLFTAVIMPGLLIYVMYSFMGGAMVSMFTTDEGYIYSVQTVNAPDSFKAMAGELPFELKEIGTEGEAEAKAQISEKSLDLLAVFPENFDADVAGYDISSGAAAPQVALYYNSSETSSNEAYRMAGSLLDEYEKGLVNKFDVNASQDESYDLVTEQDAAGFMFSSMMPMLMMMFLFSGCMAVAPESIAGEKERGTIATILITPVKRWELAAGKIMALAVIALLSGASSTIGTILSMPKLMGAASDTMSAAVYGASDYALLAMIILSTVLLMVALISIISAFAKTVKEAGTWVTPLMLIVVLIGVTAMFGDGAKSDLYYYMIPLYNSVQCMIGVFGFDISATAVLVTVITNLVLTGICCFVLTKMFNSEKVMFSK